MKKILLCLVIFIFPTIVSVEAKTIKDYQIIKEYGPYQKNPSLEYPYLSDEFIIKEESMLETYPKEEENREIYEEVYYKAYKEAPIRKMGITNFLSYNGKNFPLTEIEVFNDNKKVSFTIKCNTCNEVESFKDQNKDDVIPNLTNISVIEIILDEPCEKEDLKVILYFQKDVEKNFYYALSWSHNTKKDFPAIGYPPELLYVRFSERINGRDITFKEATYSKDKLIYYCYDEEPIYLKNIPEQGLKWTNITTLYGYKEKWYKSYRLIEVPIYNEPEKEDLSQEHWQIETKITNNLPKNTQNNKDKNSNTKNLTLEVKLENSKILFYKKSIKSLKKMQFRHYYILIMIIVLGILFFLLKLTKRSRYIARN